MEEPKIDIQQKLIELSNRTKSIIEIGGGKKPVKIGWLHIYTMDKLTEFTLEVELSEPTTEAEQMIFAKKQHRLIAKSAACILLNSYWKIRLFLWFFWRWIVFVRGYDDNQMAQIIINGQKKNPLDACCMAIQYLMATKTSMMKMTEKEAKQSQAAQALE